MGLKERKQIVWIKTKDTPPKSWREFFPDEAALAKEQAKWLHINTRRRNNIPGLLPIFEGMQIRINNGSGSHYKEYGLHTGSLGTVVGMQLSEDDTNKLQHNQSPEVTLDNLPEKIFIKVQGKMTKCFPGLEEGIFPIVPRTTDWHLFSSEDTTVTIHTKGYAISPYYSSTIDSITGRTVDKAIVDIPDWQAFTRYSTAMKIYIAMSRVRKAHDILLDKVMSPTLFRCGAHPWPTALLNVLRNVTGRPDPETCKTLTKQNDKYFKIDDLFFSAAHVNDHSQGVTSAIQS